MDAATRHHPARARDRVPAVPVLAAVAVALVPVAVAAARAVGEDWQPVGDDALYPIRSRDVSTLDHLPLLGTWSSASLNVGTNINHPGPLLFDLLALPVRVFGGGTGTAVGIALINAAALVGIAVFAGRRGGWLASLAATATAATLAWSMGSELLYEPWGPHSMLLPFLLFLVLVWSAAAGDLLALPVGAVVGTLLVQTHLSYSFFVPVLGGVAVVALLLSTRRQRREARPDRSRLARASAVAVVVLLLCWAQPLIEQVTGDGKGNLSRLVSTGASSDTGTVGSGRAVRIAARVVALPPWWARPSLREAFRSSGRNPSEDPRLGLAELPSRGVASLSLLGLLALLALGWWWGRRRGDPAAQWAGVVAAVAIVVAVATAGRTPVTGFGVPAHQFIWLWPVAAFATLVLVLTLVVPALPGPRTVRSLGVALAGVVLVVSALNLPASSQSIGPNDYVWALPAIRDLSSQLGALRDRAPLLVDDLAGTKRFASPYEYALLAELQRREIEFVATDAGLLRQIGPARRSNGEARAELLLTIGPDPEVPTRSERVAHHEGLSARQRGELDRVEARAADLVRSGDVRLNEAGEDAVRDGRLPGAAAFDPAADPLPVLRSGILAAVIDGDMLDVEDRTGELLRRYVELIRMRDLETIALYLRPLPDEPASASASVRRASSTNNGFVSA